MTEMNLFSVWMSCKHTSSSLEIPLGKTGSESEWLRESIFDRLILPKLMRSANLRELSDSLPVDDPVEFDLRVSLRLKILSNEA